MARMKDPSQTTGNNISNEDREKQIKKKQKMASKIDTKLIENEKYYPKILKNEKGDSKEIKTLKKSWREQFDKYIDVLMKQEDYPGQYVSDNDIDKLVKIIMLESEEMDLIYRIAISFDDDEKKELSTTLKKLSAEIKSKKKGYPLDAESMNALAKKVETQAQDKANPLNILTSMQFIGKQTNVNK